MGKGEEDKGAWRKLKIRSNPKKKTKEKVVGQREEDNGLAQKARENLNGKREVDKGLVEKAREKM